MLRSATPIVRNDDATMSKNTSIRDVLAVVDGTASSLTGVDQAVAYAGLYDAALTIVVVTENLAWAAAVDPMAYATAMEVSDAQRKEHVVAVRKRAEGAPVHVEVHALFEAPGLLPGLAKARSEEHTSELQSLMRISYAVFCLKKTRITRTKTHTAQP